MKTVVVCVLRRSDEIHGIFTSTRLAYAHMHHCPHGCYALELPLRAFDTAERLAAELRLSHRFAVDVSDVRRSQRRARATILEIN